MSIFLNNTSCVRWIVAVFFVLMYSFTSAQGYFKMPKGVKKQLIHFKLINNLIVIPLSINNEKGDFILDSGVSKTILFKSADSKNVFPIDARKVKLSGFGNGEFIEAIISKNNYLKFGKIEGFNQTLLLLLDEKINFSSKLGMTINGIIGYDFFKDFVVKINYRTKIITFCKPEFFKEKKGKSYVEIPIELYKGKPYVNGEISIQDKDTIPVKLLIDTGGSYTLWFFEDDEKGISVPKNNFTDFLGEGITGNIFGKRARINKFFLRKFAFNEPIVSFLHGEPIIKTKMLEGRNGSIGGGILKRFTVWFYYRNKKIILKKNSKYKEKFYYNMSGLELNHNGYILVAQPEVASYFINEKKPPLRFRQYKFVLKPSYIVSNVREGSPGHINGVKEGDILLKINNKQSYKMNLEEINYFFYEKINREIKLVVERDGVQMTFRFQLKNEL